MGGYFVACNEKSNPKKFSNKIGTYWTWKECWKRLGKQDYILESCISLRPHRVVITAGLFWELRYREETTSVFYQRLYNSNPYLAWEEGEGEGGIKKKKVFFFFWVTLSLSPKKHSIEVGYIKYNATLIWQSDWDSCKLPHWKLDIDIRGLQRHCAWQEFKQDAHFTCRYGTWLYLVNSSFLPTNSPV